jgi:alpha/beta superfamily hydrolase
LKSVSVKFPCGDITLEGELFFPDGEGSFPGVIVCHPFPPHGGSMQSSVVTAIWQALSRYSIAALRFNFRGVGNSEGSFGEGVTEREDVKAALGYVLSTKGIDDKRIGLAGYSFGAMMSLPVALQDERVRLLALVSAPLSESNWEKLNGYKKPCLLVVGEDDQMVSLELFRKQMEKPSGTVRYHIISGADHFLGGYEEEVARIVAQFFAEGFNQE